MGKQTKEKAYTKLIEQIVAGLLSFLQLQMKEKKWKRAFIQNLWPASGPGTGGLQKFRIELPNGSLISDLFTPMKIDVLIGKAWKQQKGVFPKTWYGITLTLFPDGKYETTYNYDQHCVRNDQTFFDT
jgi:hypothetical protein